jgi:all-trans-retinol dehydrogenase (NAD+)
VGALVNNAGVVSGATAGQAVIKGRKRLIMPRFAYSTLLLRLLPPSALDAMADFFGINHSMDEFTGRKGGE